MASKKYCLKGHSAKIYGRTTAKGCKECARLRSVEWRKNHPGQSIALVTTWIKNNPHKPLEYALTQKCKEVGITSSYYNSLPKICSNPGCKSTTPGGRGRFSIDHDHSIVKGKYSFRGLLCSSCNVILGLANDDTRKLEGLISYLKASSSRLVCRK